MASAAFPHARSAAAAVPGQNRYGSLAALLRERILRGEWRPGDAIPPEAELARAHAVALGTMRQAIAVLVAEGLLERRHGRGTFVRQGMSGASMLRFFRFRPPGGAEPVPQSRVLRRQIGAPTRDQAEALGLAHGPDAQVLLLERLRSLDGKPCLLEKIALPLPLFASLADTDAATWDDLFYPMYQRLCGVVVHRVQDQLRFGALTPGQARRLGLAPSHPCVRVQRRAFDLAGRCVEWRTTWGDALAFEYTAQIQ
ncbi:MAG: GntR family transcriptional regulator [Pseudomonadota bacterium]|nr:GntR family transcriptional regulator [Pseudomonadota bacterium]